MELAIYDYSSPGTQGNRIGYHLKEFQSGAFVVGLDNKKPVAL